MFEQANVLIGNLSGGSSGGDADEPKSSLAVFRKGADESQAMDEDDDDDVVAAAFERTGADNGIAEMVLLGNDMMTDILCQGGDGGANSTSTRNTTAVKLSKTPMKTRKHKPGPKQRAGGSGDGGLVTDAPITTRIKNKSNGNPSANAGERQRPRWRQAWFGGRGPVCSLF